MPINSLTIKNVASYDATGVTLNNIKKLNFFFGYNGSGKSTIAKYMRNITLPSSEQSPEFNDCSVSGYNPNKEIILVYDEIFKKENFIDSDKIKGVFSLNKKNAEIDVKISNLEDNILNLELYLQNIETKTKYNEDNINTIRRKLVEDCFSAREPFKSFIKQPLQYRGNKEQNYNYIKNVLNNTSSTVSFNDIVEEYNRIYEHDYKEINICIDNDIYDNFNKAEKDLDKVLKKIIIGKESVDIAELIHKLNNSSWVNEGRIYLDKTDICPFCQQPINNKVELTTMLNDFFDETYKNDIESITRAKENYDKAYKALKDRLTSLKNFSCINIFCDKILTQLNDLHIENTDTIRNKITSPNEIKELIFYKNLNEEIININNLIQENNENFINIDNLKKEWVKNCWSHIALKMKDKIESFEKKEKYANKRLKKAYELHKDILTNRINFYRQKIEKLRQQTVNTKEAVENINKILNSVGFKDFSIEEVQSTSSSTQYRLKRISSTSSTNIYHSLSEGEKTFISFLYFYQLCLGTNDISNSTLKKIIIIDDPISSLDSQILFIVSSIIHKLDMKDSSNKDNFKDKNISQIIILTHNLYFYKEISFERRPFCNDKMHYRVHKPIGGHSQIDFSTKQYPTDDYNLLWKSIKENKNTRGIDENRNIMICNVMRRIIDSYVGFIGLFQGTGNPTWTAINSLSTTDPKYIVASSFISQINDESHGISPFDSTYYGNVIKQDTSILYDAFKLIFDEIGKDHYNMMMS